MSDSYLSRVITLHSYNIGYTTVTMYTRMNHLNTRTILMCYTCIYFSRTRGFAISSLIEHVLSLITKDRVVIARRDVVIATTDKCPWLRAPILKVPPRR